MKKVKKKKKKSNPIREKNFKQKQRFSTHNEKCWNYSKHGKNLAISISSFHSPPSVSHLISFPFQTNPANNHEINNKKISPNTLETPTILWKRKKYKTHKTSPIPLPPFPPGLSIYFSSQPSLIIAPYPKNIIPIRFPPYVSRITAKGGKDKSGWGFVEEVGENILKDVREGK